MCVCRREGRETENNAWVLYLISTLRRWFYHADGVRTGLALSVHDSIVQCHSPGAVVDTLSNQLTYYTGVGLYVAQQERARIV